MERTTVVSNVAVWTSSLGGTIAQSVGFIGDFSKRMGSPNKRLCKFWKVLCKKSLCSKKHCFYPLNQTEADVQRKYEGPPGTKRKEIDSGEKHVKQSSQYKVYVALMQLCRQRPWTKQPNGVRTLYRLLPFFDWKDWMRLFLKQAQGEAESKKNLTRHRDVCLLGELLWICRDWAGVIFWRLRLLPELQPPSLISWVWHLKIKKTAAT